MMFRTIDDEKKALKYLFKQTTDPILQLHLIEFGKSINDLLNKNELLFFDTLNGKNMEKVINNIDFQKLNKRIEDMGYLESK